ncbi:hypothetical protein [Kitasatospora sp. NPDC059327]|uniref:hypothetical protein n=1 Tax=Kitasatospora sp. NPDC059327 TaxID=3346803 RepID=UPI0036A4B507
MSGTTRVRRSRRTVTAAAALGVVALSGSLALPSQSAFAGTAPGVKLAVQAPASVGFAGQPVAFTETITNTGAEAATYALSLTTTSEQGTPSDAVTIGYKDPANGAWKSVPLEFRTGTDTATYDGTVRGITVPAGRTVKLSMRIGAPMGLPHRGATNGGFRAMALRSAVTLPGSDVALAEQVKTIKVESIRTSLASVPATAVAGGAPVEFDAVLANPTPSGYVNLGNVLFSDAHATVQVREADGTWTTPRKVTGGTAGDLTGVYLRGRDSTIGAGKTLVTRVRVSYDANTPLGASRISPCLFVNEGSVPFQGTTLCGSGSTVKVVAPTGAPVRPTAAPAAKVPAKVPAKPAAAEPVAKVPAEPVAAAQPTAAAPAPAPATVPAADPAAPVVGELAATGAGTDLAQVVAAAVLSTLGAAAVLLARRLRRRA